jgi:hypothetical protein
MDAFLFSDPDDEPVSEEKTAQFLNVTLNTLRSWRSLGRGPRYRKRGRTIEYTPRLIKEYLATRVFSPTSAKARKAQKALQETTAV